MMAETVQMEIQTLRTNFFATPALKPYLSVGVIKCLKKSVLQENTENYSKFINFCLHACFFVKSASPAHSKRRAVSLWQTDDSSDNVKPLILTQCINSSAFTLNLNTFISITAVETFKKLRHLNFTKWKEVLLDRQNKYKPVHLPAIEKREENIQKFLNLAFVLQNPQEGAIVSILIGHCLNKGTTH